MGFELGETYSGYKFLDVSRRSKYGVEYRVQNTLAQRMEVLRALPQTAQDDQEQTERFMREVRVRARLVHPNIVTLFNAIELDRQLAMTTELVEGTTLAERLTLGPMPSRDAVILFGQALAAAGFAHEQQVVHRDINPENIIITPDGVLKLANFALAKMAASPKLTQVGAVLGNLKYISPEQVKGTAEADARSDLYSLGMVLYEMLCGRPPFDSQSQFELMAAHVNEIPKPPSAWNAKIPPELDAVVLKSIAKDPAQRYQTAQEFTEALAKADPDRAEQPAAAAGHTAAEDGQLLMDFAASTRTEPPVDVTLVETVAVNTAAACPPPAGKMAQVPAPQPVRIPAFLIAAPVRATMSWFFVSGAAAACFVLFMVLWFSSK
jgi:eukaryotic-like serine/threonine-protein kinase